ncbi:glycosyltransferase family 2 protein [Youngiibacter fragilis]|uniref:Glycosyl transferase n=1 Tax=Youngiibacter fragilis 232.1 TaxID=994573 RepID=V7I3U1_9CLOT|nr:glycosyltransferase family 2 protein [Youngiibacter fragilis]ETA80920.1 glycosyl transferase [Youngiibacter fragilis 232.1]
MKLLSIAVPCYNSQEYMRNCIESLLPGGEQVEILVIDDGSSDDTGLIADEYAERFPLIVRAIHQKNAGHGGAVNTGMRNAAGRYFKVVDSDDWVDLDAYKRILETIGRMVEQGSDVDLFVSNFVYEKQGNLVNMAMRYRNALPEERIITWDEVKRFRKGQYMLMHSVIFRMDVLKESGLILPEHTFYVDNLFVYVPMQHVKTLYYIDVDFYRYFIGRADQSVNEAVMIRRIDQQIKVNRLMFEQVDLDSVTNVRQRRYMLNYLEIVTIVTSIMLIRSGTAENLRKKRDLWQFIKTRNKRIYRHFRRGFLGATVNLPGRFGRIVSIAVYKVSRKVVGFN